MSVAAADILPDPSVPRELAQPPLPPSDDNGGNDGNGGPNPKRRRRLIITAASILLVLLLIGVGVFAAFTWQAPSIGTANPNTPAGTMATATPIPGPRLFQLALDQGALTSLFVKQLGLQQGVFTDLRVAPTPHDGLILSLNLHIDASGIHRVMPIEIDGTIDLDKHQNIHLNVLHLKRDGIDAGPAAAASMGQTVNQMLLSSVMPSLRGQLKGVKLISAHTSTSIGCAQATEMLVLLIEAPAIQGIAAQPTPVPFCFKGPIDSNKLLPQ
jgi:hypothetical protein